MIDKTSADHYTWGQKCDGWHLVKSEAFSVIQECMPPSTAEVRHRHAFARQFFFVLSGNAIIECDGRRETLRDHQGLEIAPGLVHQVFNESEKDLHFLVFSCPPGHGDRITG